MSNYQEYLPASFARLRDQALRRLSESSPGLPPLPPLAEWTARFWNSASPPPSIDEDEEIEHRESTVQALARTIQLWTNQLNADPFPSPPLDPVVQPLSPTSPPPSDESTTAFPPLEQNGTQAARPSRLQDARANSDTSLNPARTLQIRSRAFTDQNRGHSQSDPLAAVQPPTAAAARRRLPDADTYMQDGVHRRRDGSDALPEDDGMGPLRHRINAIWTGPGTPLEKSKLIHILMNERHKAASQHGHATSRRPTTSVPRLGSPLSLAQEPSFRLSDADLTPSFAPLGVDEGDDHVEEPVPRHLGCVHYRRNVKMQCFTCEKWYTCRLCHDEVENHVLPRRDTRFMLCMLCKSPQGVSQFCKVCGEQAGNYYCAICKLWNNDPYKSIYHCNDCGLCRLGEGLGKDFFHCKTCAACMSIEAEATHKCIERSTKCDCPICGEYLFTSSLPVSFMQCGHSIHSSCFKDLCNTTYKCPICSKSIANMESQFRRLDRSIEEQPMPPDYADKKAYIFCNDCNSRCVAAYHWLGTKCVLCDSYNTVQLEMVGDERETLQMQMQEERAQDRAAQEGGIVGERSITVSQSHTPTEELIPPGVPIDQMGSLPRQVQRPSYSQPSTIATSPRVTSPFLMPHSPSSRSARSVSPVVGSYFGTSVSESQRPLTPNTVASASGAVGVAASMAAAAGAEFYRRISTAGRASPRELNDEDDDMDFLGGQSPRVLEQILGKRGAEDESSSGESESEDDDEETDAMDEGDDDEGDDGFAIFGHR
jgi:uncharacterized CHY-type Zn-finger protein